MGIEERVTSKKVGPWEKGVRELGVSGQCPRGMKKHQTAWEGSLATGVVGAEVREVLSRLHRAGP